MSCVFRLLLAKVLVLVLMVLVGILLALVLVLVLSGDFNHFRIPAVVSYSRPVTGAQPLAGQMTTGSTARCSPLT